MKPSVPFRQYPGGGTNHGTHSAGLGNVRQITSLTNPLIKELRTLHRKRHRDESKVFIAEGLKLVIDAVDLNWTIRTLVYAASSRGNETVERMAARTAARGGQVLQVSEKILSAITRRDNPQMVIGVFEQRSTRLTDLPVLQNSVLVVLDRARDPGNLGTIVRTVDAAGAHGVILVGESTDPYASDAVRASMGSIFSVPLCQVNQDQFLSWRASYPGLVAGTHLSGTTDYRALAYEGRPAMLIMGNEQQGLNDAMSAACDHLVRIPQAGRADSLNLAVATGLMLFEARRAHLKL